MHPRNIGPYWQQESAENKCISYTCLCEENKREREKKRKRERAARVARICKPKQYKPIRRFAYSRTRTVLNALNGRLVRGRLQ